MKKVFGALSRAGSFALLAFTIYWLPKDIQDSPEAAGPWRKLIAMVDQNTLLWVLVIALILSILWSDLRPAYRVWHEKRKKSPLEVSISLNTFEWEREGAKIYTIGLFEVKNSSDVSLDGIEVHLLGILLPNKQHRMIRRKLYTEASGENRFNILPGQAIRIKLFRSGVNIPQELEFGTILKSKLEIGPFFDNEYVEMSSSGSYKLDIAIYGKNIKPIHEAFGIAVDGDSYSLGRWTEGFKSPLRVSCRLHPSTELETQP